MLLAFLIFSWFVHRIWIITNWNRQRTKCGHVFSHFNLPRRYCASYSLAFFCASKMENWFKFIRECDTCDRFIRQRRRSVSFCELIERVHYKNLSKIFQMICTKFFEFLWFIPIIYVTNHHWFRIKFICWRKNCTHSKQMTKVEKKRPLEQKCAMS